MFLSIAINEVNSEAAREFGVDVSLMPARRVLYIYKQYFTGAITLREAAEDVHGVLLDNQLFNPK